MFLFPQPLSVPGDLTFSHRYNFMIHSQPCLKFSYCMSPCISVLNAGILKLGIMYPIKSSKNNDIMLKFLLLRNVLYNLQ